MIITKYKNGNTEVEIFQDGTKIRRGIGEPDFPETIDVKITNYCDLGCKYCHESSTTEGIDGDLESLKEVLDILPSGIELAIGGGNPLSHKDLYSFLKWAKDKGFICNLTVNQGHLGTYYEDIKLLISEDLVKGIGVSITSNNFKYLDLLSELTPNLVYHIIAGVNSIDILDKLKGKFLILGYKSFGFGIDYYSDEVKNNLKYWNTYIIKYIGKVHLSFDNLAIEQLNVKRFFTDKGWETLYMGDDFTYSMYIDAVNKEYSPTSRTKDNRVNFSDMSILEYFNRYNYGKRVN